MIVIGSGAGGASVSYKLANAGKRVLLIEKGPFLPRDKSTLEVRQVFVDGIFKNHLVWLDSKGQDFVPSDPLVAARIERIRETGGNPFVEYQTPMAVLELKQGLGRLLRRSSDRGILAVLDPRLTTKPYGKTFLRSLPPFPRTRSLAGCRDFFCAGAEGAPTP